jgi:hypothetical protein
MSPDLEPDPAAKRARQKRTITIIAVALIGGGLAILLFLQRMPLPIRLLAGLTDVFAGLVLLVVARQKF